MTTARRRRSSYSFWIRKINHSSNSRYVVFVVIKRVTQWCDWCEYLEMWEDKADVSHYSQPVSVMKRKSQESQAVIQVDRMSATCFCSLTNPSKEKTTLGLLTKSKDIVLKHNIQSIDRDFKEKCVIRSSEQLSKRIQRNHRKNRGICSDSFTFWTYLSTIGSCQATIIKEREKKRNCQETNFICSIFFLARKTKHFFDFLNNKWKRRVRMNCHEKFISIEVVHWISWNPRRMSGNSFEKKNGRFFSNTNFSLSRSRSFIWISFIMALAVQSVTSSHPSSISTGQRTSRPITANPSDSANTKFVVDWSSSSTSTNRTKATDENLQEAFRRFREQRMVRK